VIAGGGGVWVGRGKMERGVDFWLCIHFSLSLAEHVLLREEPQCQGEMKE